MIWTHDTKEKIKQGKDLGISFNVEIAEDPFTKIGQWCVVCQTLGKDVMFSIRLIRDNDGQTKWIVEQKGLKVVRLPWDGQPCRFEVIKHVHSQHGLTAVKFNGKPVLAEIGPNTKDKLTAFGIGAYASGNVEAVAKFWGIQTDQGNAGKRERF